MFSRNYHAHLILMLKNSEEKLMGFCFVLLLFVGFLIFFFFFFFSPRDLKRKSNQVKDCKAKIELLGAYDPQKQLIIEDPYYVRNYFGSLIKTCVYIAYNLAKFHSSYGIYEMYICISYIYLMMFNINYRNRK